MFESLCLQQAKTKTFKGKNAPCREECIGNAQSVLSNIKQLAALDRWARNLEHVCPWEISQKHCVAIYFKSIATAWTNRGCSQLWPSLAPPWHKLLSFPPGLLILLPGREQHVLYGILSLNFWGQWGESKGTSQEDGRIQVCRLFLFVASYI